MTSRKKFYNILEENFFAKTLSKTVYFPKSYSITETCLSFHVFYVIFKSNKRFYSHKRHYADHLTYDIHIYTKSCEIMHKSKKISYFSIQLRFNHWKTYPQFLEIIEIFKNHNHRHILKCYSVFGINMKRLFVWYDSINNVSHTKKARVMKLI